MPYSAVQSSNSKMSHFRPFFSFSIGINPSNYVTVCGLRQYGEIVGRLVCCACLVFLLIFFFPFFGCEIVLFFCFCFFEFLSWCNLSNFVPGHGACLRAQQADGGGWRVHHHRVGQHEWPFDGGLKGQWNRLAAGRPGIRGLTHGWSAISIGNIFGTIEETAHEVFQFGKWICALQSQISLRFHIEIFLSCRVRLMG